MVKGKLTDEAKTYVVTALACFDTPSEVVKAVSQEFNIEITKQSVEKYDPTKVAGCKLARRWIALFEATRRGFIEDVSTIPIAHRAVRLRTLERAIEKAEKQGNLALVAQLVEQAAKEVGDIYTNSRQFTGPRGRPLFPTPITKDMTDQEAAETWAQTLRSINGNN